MPAPMNAFAAICQSIAGIDPGDVGAIDDFFLKDFATLDQIIRETAFNWALSLDQEPTEDDRDALNALLASVGFRPQRPTDERAPSTVTADDDRQCA